MPIIALSLLSLPCLFVSKFIRSKVPSPFPPQERQMCCGFKMHPGLLQLVNQLASVRGRELGRRPLPAHNLSESAISSYFHPKTSDFLPGESKKTTGSRIERESLFPSSWCEVQKTGFIPARNTRQMDGGGSF